MLTVWGRRSSFNLQKVMWLVGELELPHRLRGPRPNRVRSGPPQQSGSEPSVSRFLMMVRGSLGSCNPSVSAVIPKGMGYDPVPRNIDAPRDPYPLVPHGVIEKPFECCGAAGSSRKTAMQPDRHHARAALTLPIEHVKRVLEIGKVLVPGVEPCAVAKRMSFESKA